MLVAHHLNASLVLAVAVVFFGVSVLGVGVGDVFGARYERVGAVAGDVTLVLAFETGTRSGALLDVDVGEVSRYRCRSIFLGLTCGLAKLIVRSQLVWCHG